MNIFVEKLKQTGLFMFYTKNDINSIVKKWYRIEIYLLEVMDMKINEKKEIRKNERFYTLCGFKYF